MNERSFALQEIEKRIIRLYEDNICHSVNSKRDVKHYKEVLISEYLSFRKTLLDKEFVFNEYNIKQLEIFNNILKDEVLRFKCKYEKIYNDFVEKKNYDKDLTDCTIEAKLLFSYDYPVNRIDQSEEEKKIWEILQEYNTHSYIEDGITSKVYLQPKNDNTEDKSWSLNTNYMLWLNKDTTIDNWNEHLDTQATKSLNLIYPFHNLYCNTFFALEDIIYVEKFSTEINIQIDY